MSGSIRLMSKSTGRWIGDDYAVPTKAGDAAIRWAGNERRMAARPDLLRQGHVRWLSGLADEGRFGDGNVVFIHTGGWPALFAADGIPA